MKLLGMKLFSVYCYCFLCLLSARQACACRMGDRVTYNCQSSTMKALTLLLAVLYQPIQRCDVACYMPD